MIACENLEGALLVKATLFAGPQVDTTGSLVFDTGAGYLALDGDLLAALDLADSTVEPMTFAPRPLARLRIGEFEQDAVGPILCVDTEVIEQATDRRVFGLLGQQPLGSFAVQIDYLVDSLALIPMPRDGIMATRPRRPIAVDMAASSAATSMAKRASREALAGALPASAIGFPFELEGDGKIVVQARLGSDDSRGGELALVLDTGATKTVIFESALARVAGAQGWPELHGLSSPTLYGSEDVHLVRAPAIALGRGAGGVVARDVDIAVMKSELQAALSRAVRREVDGLLGYSFLRRFRVTIDYPHRLLWLEPLDVPRDPRPNEYSHVGVQVERRAGELRVVAVAEGSPAASAGIRAGDVVEGIDGTPAAGLDVVTLSRRLEGPPGSRVVLRLRRGGETREHRLTRRQLL